MANTQSIVSIIIFVAFLMTSFSAVNTQTPAPAPSPGCFMALLNLSDCLTYVEAQSNVTVPESGCCPGLAGLVDNTPECLCELLGNSAQYGIEINSTKALMLPSVCHVTTPPLSLCSVFGVPIPAASPSPLSPGSTVYGVPIPAASSSPLSPGSTGSSPTANSPGSLPEGGSGSASLTVSNLVLTIGLSCATIAIF